MGGAEPLRVYDSDGVPLRWAYNFLRIAYSRR